MSNSTLAEETEPTWTTEELQRVFEVIAFAAPFVLVRRRSQDRRGTLEFTHRPRTYSTWTGGGT
jgi:hypothetical protein